MSDMVTYFENEPLPEISFTPDSDYGICFAEKGILQLKISMDRNDGTTLSDFKVLDPWDGSITTGANYGYSYGYHVVTVDN